MNMKVLGSHEHEHVANITKLKWQQKSSFIPQAMAWLIVA
jgi:hypothetical protein